LRLPEFMTIGVVFSRRIIVELLGVREESVIIYLWGMNPLAYFS
jgi:hypothetical protein